MLPTEVRYETEVYRWFHEYAVKVGRAGGITTIRMRPFFLLRNNPPHNGKIL